MLLLVGCGATAMTILVCGLAGTVLVSGAAGGRTVYRTLFYFPHFTAGVATFLLWKKLYSPHGGPINNALAPVLQGVSGIVSGIPDSLVSGASWPCALAMCAAVGFGARGLRRAWRDGEVGWLSMTLGCLLLLFPVIMTPFWMSNGWAACVVILAAVAAFGYLASGIVNKRSYTCVADGGIGFALISCGALMIAAFFMLGIGNVFWHLPVMNADGLEAPEWLSTSSWAKPSIMLMGFWMAIGSNNMLLYLAGLSNIPVALYEAAEIDGASRLQRFWHVTWPQLAPVTFFILVMAMIHSLQGGFEMARTMTEGGPAGSTTTLSYYIYTEGFVSGRLGYASAISWALFALIFCVTMFNWKFGSRYTND
jgi:multiple sugar transport system permease protein